MSILSYHLPLICNDGWEDQKFEIWHVLHVWIDLNSPLNRILIIFF